MQKCLIYNSSLRFSRAVSGLLLLLAVAVRNQWLVLAVIILTSLSAFSLKFNIFYQIHSFILSKFSKRKHLPAPRESGELSFVAGATGVLLSIGFLLLYFGKFVDFAWAFLLVVDLMIFLACFVGFCVATMMYILLKKLFKK
ncbi:MAG: DUF4395 family protein [Candidatus Gribaldobacteria bacterium]|nr:DUF4395 family protein [Candidatus Gribaldobacteria bacterium]